MTRYVFPYKDYYKQSFIDPLYLPYFLPKTLKINPYTMNENEIRYDRGKRFRKKHSGYPCPMGFKNEYMDFCVPLNSSQIPHFYTSLYKNVVNRDIPLMDFTNYPNSVGSVYP